MSRCMRPHDRSRLCSTSLPFRFLALSFNGNNVSRNYTVDMNVPTLIGTKSKHTFIQQPCSVLYNRNTGISLFLMGVQILFQMWRNPRTDHVSPLKFR